MNILCWALALWHGSMWVFFFLFSNFSNHLVAEERELVVSPYLCCGCLCSVFPPRYAVGWSVIVLALMLCRTQSRSSYSEGVDLCSIIGLQVGMFIHRGVYRVPSRYVFS